MSEAQQQSIDLADWHAEQAGLPTYTELRQALGEAIKHAPVVTLAEPINVFFNAGGKLQ